MTDMRKKFIDVARLDTGLVAARWPWAEREAARIDAHWRARRAEKPKMFDGDVLLLRDPELVDSPEGRILRGDFFLTKFRNFLAWRDWATPDRSVYNCFAMAALRARDRAWLLGEMGAHTMNPGRVYFAAGTPDRSDIRGDRVDLAGSVAREMQEETGFSPEEAAPEGFRVLMEDQKIACLQERRLDLTADEAIARVAAFLARDPEPELNRLVAVRDEHDIDPTVMPGFIVTFLREALALA